ncbi:MAG: glycosyltransferase family 4 protein [Saprospiraceae bacterium]
MSKIAVIIPHQFVPPANGGHAAGYGFCEFLAKEREIVVISTTNNPDLPLPFRLERLFSDRFYKYFSPLVGLRLYQFLKKEHITHCVIQQPFIGLLILPIVKLLNIRLLVYSHNIEYQRFQTIGKWWWRFLWLVEWLLYRNANAVLFISRDDMREAIPIFKLNPNRCFEMPYGTRYPSTPPGRDEARKIITQRHQLDPQAFLILFFATHSYKPNTDALERILDIINPILLQKADFPYKILICGGGLPERFNKLTAYQEKNIHYVGFVDKIDEYIQACDVTLNPVITGGGVKTKMVEAIALGTPVISAKTGAKGVDPVACGDKLVILQDDDNQGFAAAILHLKSKYYMPTPASFYKEYYWANAIQPALKEMQDTRHQMPDVPS